MLGGIVYETLVVVPAWSAALAAGFLATLRFSLPASRGNSD